MSRPRRQVPVWMIGLGWCLSLIGAGPLLTAPPARRTAPVSSPPLLNWAEEVMGRYARTAATVPVEGVPLGMFRWVDTVHWSEGRGPIVVGVQPSLVRRQWLRFGSQEAGAIRPIGRCGSIEFDTLSCWSRIMEPGGRLWAVFVDLQTRSVTGTVDVDASREHVARRSGPIEELAFLPISLAIEPPRSMEFPCQTGAVVLFDGQGHTLASGSLPDHLWVVLVRAPRVHAWNGSFECALPTVSSRKAPRCHGYPPSDVSLLRIHGKDAPVQIVVTLRPDPEWDTNAAAPRVDFHSLDQPVLAADGSRLAYRENARWESPDSGEKLQLLRLWVWDRSRAQRVLVDQIAFYRGPNGSSLLSSRGDGQVLERKWVSEVWSETAQLGPALSPDGRRVAYQRGKELCIRDVPEP